MEQIKQTAVEWLADKIKWNWQDIEFGEISMSTLVEQAKAMEKEQIIESYKDSTCQFSVDSRIDCPKSAEQYLNEKYGK